MPNYIRASDLYELATCPHRITLDRRLPRDARRAPDAATAALIERGRVLEDEVASALDFPRPEFEPPDWAAGAAATRALMERGVPGIYQAVLFEDGLLAIPDLLERVEGDAPRLGTAWHYAPGDVKAGLSPRSDQVLQVAFAGLLLERVQGVSPGDGFLVLGDRSRESFPLSGLAHVLAAALARVREIVAGSEETEPFYDDACGRCRWYGACVPGLLDGGDLSLVDGMTPTRRRVLRRAGLTSVADLARLDRSTWRARGLPALGLESLVPQARALATRSFETPRALELPRPSAGDLVVHVERDPLDREDVIVLAWRAASGAADPVVRVTLDPASRGTAVIELLRVAHESDAHVYHFGGTLPRSVGRLAEDARIGPDTQIAFERRLWDLGRSLRRGTAFLPVRRYRLDEIVAALDGAPLPGPDTDEGTPTFVLAANLRAGVPGPWREQVEAQCAGTLARMVRLHEWLRTQRTRAPRGAS